MKAGTASRRLQTETRLTRPLVSVRRPHAAGKLFHQRSGAPPTRSAIAERPTARGLIGALVGAHATNEEIFALKSFMNDVIGSDLIGGMSYTPPGAQRRRRSFAARQQKSQYSPACMALGVGLDGLDRLAPGGRVRSAQSPDRACAPTRCRALGEAEFVKRFGALDYLLVLDTDACETAQMANQVIPIAAYPELEGTFTNFQGVVQRLHRAFDPPGEAKPAIEVLTDLGMVLDGVERPQTARAHICRNCWRAKRPSPA